MTVMMIMMMRRRSKEGVFVTTTEGKGTSLRWDECWR
jgi:hypothetical protein